MADFNEDAVGKDVLKALATSFGDNAFTDLTVEVDDVEFPCHKLVLCLHSAWFEKALMGGYKEAATSRITLGGDEPDVIKAMIEYCYRLDYTSPSTRKEETVLFHAKIFAAAEKYFIPTLQQRAASYFASDLEAFEPPALAFVEAAKFVYTNTSDSKKLLRESLVKPIYEDPETINQDSGNEALTLALDSLPVFAADVARALASDTQLGRSKESEASHVPEERAFVARPGQPTVSMMSNPIVGDLEGHVYGCPCGCGKMIWAHIPNDDNLYRYNFRCASGFPPRRMSGIAWQSYVLL